MEKKKNIWTYFIKMIFLFALIFIVQQFGTVILANSFTYLRYGPEIILEAIWAILVLIVVLIFKNSYIFSKDRESFSNSLKFGWPLIIISIIFIIINIIDIGSELNIPVLLNLATFCLLIGIVEEFLCRGWLLNEFLERFSDSKKKIILSIVLSSLVFGLSHIVNLSYQPLLTTSIQIINATLIGIAFGLIYYKTKNIWSVVFIHGFWDFSLMMSESVYLSDCISGTPSNSILLYSTIETVILIIALAIICYYLFRKTELTNKILDKKIYSVLPVIGIILYVGAATITPDDYDEYYVCTEYETKNIVQEYETQYYVHSQYSLTYTKETNTNTVNDNNQDENIVDISKCVDNFNFVLSLNDETYEIEFENKETGKKIVLAEALVYDYLLLENEDSYTILIQTDSNKVLYGRFSKDTINNSEQYLAEIKNGLTEYILPEINTIGSIKIGESNYKYALIKTNIYDKLYFDEFDNLYLISVE